MFRNINSFNIYIKNFTKNIFIFIVLILDFIFLILPTARKKNYDICCIKVDALGDFILWLNTSFSISRNYSIQKKILICNEINFELAKQLNHFEEVFPINIKKYKKNIFYRFYIMRKLRSFNSGLTIQTTFSRDILLGDSIVKAVKGKRKIGYFGDYKNQNIISKLISNNWYSELFKTNNTDIHELEINKNFLKNLQIKYFENNEIKKLTDLSNFHFDFSSKFIVINLGASDLSRVWAINKYIKLIKFIIDNSDQKLILTGTDKDILLSESIIKNLNCPKIYDFTGKTSILELIEIIRKAYFVISNDSSSIHIAFALRTKSICISSGNNFNRFVPYPKTLQSRYKPYTFFPKGCLQNDWQCAKFHRCIDEVDLLDIEKYIKSKIL